MNESTPSLHSTEKYFPHSILKRHREMTPENEKKKKKKGINDVYGALH